ncbi:hypothetical protein MA03_02740 [Infirmifilum uzonense]|uniref:Uncharacterized protein n=1 Tax=Infirmifilum uzonense TaxID=1550241 RepID=A0A0F7FGV2_9CREN|nr:hypothetical protein MA03_02740 [Infirmifilum uzonense]
MSPVYATVKPGQEPNEPRQLHAPVDSRLWVERPDPGVLLGEVARPLHVLGSESRLSEPGDPVIEARCEAP